MTLALIPLAFFTSGIEWVANNPVWSLAIVLVAVLPLGWVLSGVGLKARREYAWVLGAVSAAIILLYAYVGVEYCRTPQFHDHIEPQVAAVSCLLLRGQPVYLPPTAADQYSMIYGPFSYLWVAGYYWLMGPSLLAAKLSGVISGIAGVALLLIALKRIAGWWVALPCTALATTLYSDFQLTSLWCRPDSHELLLVSASVFALTLSNPWVASLVLGISAGIVINMKVNAFAYFIPIVPAYWLRHHQRSPLVLAGLLAAVVAAAPFLMSQISLVNYLAWLRAASHHPMHGEILDTLRFAGWLVGLTLLGGVPSIWSSRTADAKAVREWWWIAAATGAAILVTLPFAAKKGAGAHHLLPLAPVLAWMLARAWVIGNQSQTSSPEAQRVGPRHLLVLPILAVGTMFSGIAGYALADNIRGFKPINVLLVADLDDIMEGFPDRTIEMGVGGHESYAYTYTRPLLVFAGNPYHLDVAAAIDSAAAQHGLPEAINGLCRSGLADMVLIPRGDSPFSYVGPYEGEGLVFSPRFLEAFLHNYEKRYHSNFFDIYVRKSIPDPPNATKSP